MFRFLAAILAFSLASCRVGRSVFYNVADIRDERKFPSRPLTPSAQPFQFIQPAQERAPRSISRNGKETSFDDFLKSKGTVAFCIIHGDTMLYERYFDGYATAARVPSFSAAKSVTSILIGCAVADGLIRSVDQPVTDFIPEWHGRGFSAVTIGHVLQQTSGVRFNENYYNPFGHAAAFYYGRNVRDKIFRLKPERAPGTAFKYTSGNTQILGLILERALKNKTVTQYAQEKLWTPMGAEHPASWSIDQKRNGLEKTFCCINATAVDFAKIGRLFLRNGNWDGRQLVPESWVRESTTPDTTAGGAPYYKYQWWIPTPYTGDYMAQGLLGQYIYVAPAHDVIIVRLGRREGADAPWASIFRVLAQATGR